MKDYMEDLKKRTLLEILYINEQGLELKHFRYLLLKNNQLKRKYQLKREWKINSYDLFIKRPEKIDDTLFNTPSNISNHLSELDKIGYIYKKGLLTSLFNYGY